MENKEKHKVTSEVTGFYLSSDNIDWLNTEAVRAKRSRSNMLDILLTELRTNRDNAHV